MTWLLQLLVLLADRHVIMLSPFLALMVFGTADFGPTDVALVLTLSVSGLAGVWTLLAQVLRWRIKPSWYAIALVLPISCILITAGISTALKGGHLSHWLHWPQNIGSLIVPPIGEEFGWRGFALPRLQRRYGALSASLILGAIWACWHLPLFFLPGVPLNTFPLFFVGVMAGSVLLTWLYNSTGKSLLIVMLAHAGLDLGLINVPSVATYGLIFPLLIMLMYCATAAIVVLLAGPRTLCRKDHSGMIQA